jgi:DnaJ like chaperone protein
MNNNIGCFLPLILGAAGSFLRGLPGFIVGFFLGIIISQYIARRNYSRSKTMDISVLEAITKLSLVLMKADNSLMRSELFLFKNFMTQNFGVEIASKAIELLQQFKDTPLTVDVAAGDINQKLNYTERMQVLQFLFQLAGADGPVNTAEQSVLSQIAQRLRIQQGDFMRLKIMFEFMYNQQHFRTGGYNYHQQQSYSGTYNSPPLEADYAILGVKSTDSDETIKSAYLSLAVANHPDKVQHLGETARAAAEKRFSEINQAYQRIKKTRKL